MRLNVTRFSIVLATLGFSSLGNASSVAIRAEQKVVRAIALTALSPLDFGTASPGDTAKTVQPGSSENRENGSMQVLGEPNASLQILLPSEAFLSHSAASDRIRISNFNTYPDSSSLQLPNTGRQVIYIGGTRDALPPTLASGNYSGAFVVTVVYQ